MHENRGPFVPLWMLGTVVVAVLAFVIPNIGWWPPDAFTGNVPQVDSVIVPVDRGVVDDTHEKTLTWTVAPRSTVSTGMSVHDDGATTPVGRVAGTLGIDDADDCPQAVVDWTLTPPPVPAPAPPLTADAPESAELDEGPTAGASEIHLDLRRADAADCAVTVVWRHASFQEAERPAAPTPGLPGMGGGR